MQTQYYRPLVGAIAISLLVLGGCNSSSSSSTSSSSESSTSSEDALDTTADTSTETSDSSTDSTETASGTEAVDLNNFVTGALKSDPVIVDCTLSDGTETSCYQITTTGAPAGQTPGPFCPETIYDNGADSSGMWFYENGVDGIVELTGNFIQDLAVTYNDTNWQVYDPTTGNVRITDTQIACEAAAQPNVADEYNNYCVQCEMEYLEDGVLSATYLIPVTPIPADVTGSVSQVGIALNGTELSAPAPVDDILSNYTIAAFDDCGGHINTHQGYHYHAATDCVAVGTQDDGHSALLGYALDGYGIYAMKDSDGNEAEGLDECRGITDDVRGYHYHAASPGENMFVGCFHGKIVASTDAGGPADGEPPAGGPPTGTAPE
jgi:hypothetical protein